MATNPDRKLDYLVPTVPTEGQLRYVDFESTDGTVRVLQRYEWSHTDGRFDWYDVSAATQTGQQHD